MKKISNNNTAKESKKFHPFILMAAVCAIMYTVIQLILTPIYTVVLSNITLSTTLLPIVIELLLTLFEILTFALCYSIVIYAAVMRNIKATIGACGIYIAASVIRRICALGVSFFMYKYIDKTDMINVLIPVAIETAQLAVILLFACLLGKEYQKRKAARQAGNLNGIEDIHFSKVYSRSNPLMSGALIGGVMLSVVNITMRIISDINYGAPESASEVLVMIVYYMSDILLGAIFYAASWLILSKMITRYERAAEKQ